jgi:hypothetical protein
MGKAQTTKSETTKSGTDHVHFPAAHIGENKRGLSLILTGR